MCENFVSDEDLTLFFIFNRYVEFCNYIWPTFSTVDVLTKLLFCYTGGPRYMRQIGT
jgi:hypothetical protein